MINLQLPGSSSFKSLNGGSGGSFGAIANPMVGVTMMDGGGADMGSLLMGSLLGGSGFLILNIGVLGIGLMVYLVKLARGHKRNI